MKYSRVFLIVVLFSLISSAALFSQSKKKDEVSPESLSKELTQWMKSELLLNDNQASKVGEVNLDMFKSKRDIKRELKKEDKKLMNSKMKKVQKNHRKALKEILTKEQFELYKHKNGERKNKSKELKQKKN